jgi:hypothetical protein
MTAFTFDTSGAVSVPYPPPTRGFKIVTWEGLSPFEQGKTEALMADVQLQGSSRIPHFPLAFSDLAPETLARIREDCKAADHLRPGVSADGDRSAGRVFWELRQDGALDRSPPSTPYLGDDGKVYLKDPRS